MKTFHISVSPWWAPDCTRTIVFSERHTLWDVHRCIQHELALDDEHLWAFYLSGEFLDRDSEFGPGQGAASPEVHLSELSLSPGMEFAYLFDFGDDLRHDLRVERVEETDPPLGQPQVISRVGTPPPPYAPREDGAVEPRPAPPPLPEGVEPLLDEGWELAEDARSLASDAALRDRAFALTRTLLSLHPPPEAPTEVVAGYLDEVPPLLEELLQALDATGSEPELDALEDAVARLPRSDRHAHGFPPELCTDVRRLLMRYRSQEREGSDRLKRIAADELARVGEAILEACPTPARLAELGRELQTDLLVSVLLDRVEWAVAEDGPSLLPLLVRTTASMGHPQAYTLAAHLWIDRGQPARARELLARVDASALRPRSLLELAESLFEAQAYERAESTFRELYARRWLSGEVRIAAVSGLCDVLMATGREPEARRVASQEIARRNEQKAARSGTVVRQGEKIGRNDPCPCGSGKKAKKCCGVPS